MNESIVTIRITETGCYLDNHRGHYIQRDAIELAKGYGFITGEFEDFALAMYEEHNHEQGFPHEGMTELCDEAVNWLNSGQGECGDCDGTGQGIEGRNTIWIDRAGNKRCKKCTGTGRGERMAGQNFPPIIPDDTMWGWNDGDFGLFTMEDEG